MEINALSVFRTGTPNMVAFETRALLTVTEFPVPTVSSAAPGMRTRPSELALMNAPSLRVTLLPF